MVYFVKGNLSKIDNVEFLGMLNTFIVYAKEANLLNKESITFLLEKIYQVMFKIKKDTASQQYAVLRAMCDLAITITTLFTIDMTKRLFKEIDMCQQSLEITFLSSMLMLHHFRILEAD